MRHAKLVEALTGRPAIAKGGKAEPSAKQKAQRSRAARARAAAVSVTSAGPESGIEAGTNSGSVRALLREAFEG